MGLCKSRISFFQLGKIDSSTSLSSSSSKAEILIFLKPGIKICRLFGVFPCEVVQDQQSKELVLKANRKWWLVYSVIIWLFTTAYMIFQTGSFFISAGEGHSIIKLVAQSLWVSSGFVPYCVSIYMFMSPDKLIGIFESWCKIETELQALFCYIKTRNHIKKFGNTFLTLSLISISTCVYHSIMEPNNPVYPMYYYMNSKHNNISRVLLRHEVPDAAIYGYGLFQMLIMGWVWAGFAVLEGLCTLFATVFIQCMESVMEGLEFALKAGKGPEVENSIETVLESANENTSNSDKIRNSGKKETRDRLRSALTHRLLKKNGKGKEVASTMQQEEYLMFAIRNLQKFASLQSYINSVVGPLLLLDFGQLVLSACALTFLPIVFAKTLDHVSIIVFVGNWITVLSRLVLLIICLGNVYIKGQEVNVGLATTMNSCDLSPQAQSSVLAHLTVFSSNPVSFTAWGFFPITRGTLLAAFSLISTYAVVFLQLNV